MKKTLLASLLACSFFACQKEETNVLLPLQKEVTLSKEDAVITAFSKAVNTLLKEVEVRNFIKTEVQKQFNGDYEMLYKSVKGTKFLDGKTLEEKILSAAKGAFTATDLAAIPLLVISVPVHNEDWNATATIPDMVYLLSTYKDGAGYIGVNQRNENITVSDKTEPSVAYVVVKKTECCNADGTVRQKIGSTGADGNKTSALRTEGTKEYFSIFSVGDLNGIEGWAHGQPEIWVYAFSATDLAIKDAMELPKKARSNYKSGSWIKSNQLIIDPWYTAEKTGTIVYRLVEWDGNGNPLSTPITIQVTSGVTKTIGGLTDQDKDMGGTSVNFTSDYSTQYSVNYQTKFRLAPGTI
jgi:hypothetical protein